MPHPLLAIVSLVVEAWVPQQDEAPRTPPAVTLALPAVQVTDAFWAPRLQSNRTITIPHVLQQCAATGRVHNFALAAGKEKGEQQGAYPFDDSDLYKSIEAAALALEGHRDAAREQQLDRLIELIAGAQERDGYLYTARTNKAERLRGWFGAARWEKEQGSHELYDAGHLIEAGVAHFRATGQRNLLEVALRCAQRIDADFGPGRIEEPPGHEVIEMALCEGLADVTRAPRWLGLAQFFLEQRGSHAHRPDWGSYCQDQAPVLEQTEVVGHAVRAGYLYSAMTDVALRTGDARYADAVRRLWDDLVQGKLYVTGGAGATGSGEAFGAAHDLPNLNAYCETCAQIALVFWSERMLLLTGEARFADVLERTLYNAFLSGIGLDGNSFFYANPLASVSNHERVPWFSCACCPPNAARLLARVPELIYAVRGSTVFVNLLVASKAHIALPAGDVTLEQTTRYPWEGRISLRVHTPRPCKFTLRLRVPGWAREQPVPSDLYRFRDHAAPVPLLRVHSVRGDFGEPLAPGGPRLVDGYAEIDQEWNEGDEVVLDLPLRIRRVVADARVKADHGRVALQRGPIVFCAEGVDHPGTSVHSLILADDASLEATFRPDLLGGVVVLSGTAQEAARDPDEGKRVARDDVPFTAIPYYAWCNRGRTDMAVWLARELEAARPRPADALAWRSKVTASHNQQLARAVADQWEPASSNDHEVPFFHWWPELGMREWLQYDFAAPARISSAEVYWFRDTPQGGCDLPASWRLLYRHLGTWQPVQARGPYEVAKDRFVRVEFAPVETDALRLEVQCKDKVSAGVHEWRVQ